MKRLVAVAVALGLVTAACSTSKPAPTTTTSTTAPSTTTSSSTTSTTAAPPMEVRGAPDQLASLVRRTYEYAAGVDAEPPPLPEALVPTPSSRPVPAEGTATIATLHEQQIAVVEVGHDRLAAVDDGSGWRIVGGELPSLGVAPWWGAFPRLVAVVGSDARPNENVERSRSDSLHIVGLDGSGGAGIVGIPRDSYVSIPGHKTNKINAALAFGGPELMLQTLRNVTKLPIEGYLLTGFAGFPQLIDAVLGGITVDVPAAINDKASGAHLAAGTQSLSGAVALAFSRARKTIPGGDFTRQEHGGLVLLGILAAARLRGAAAIPGFLSGSQEWLYTDLNPEQLLTLSMAALDVDPQQVKNVVAPGKVGTANGASVVRLTPDAAKLFADLSDGSLGG